MVRWVFQHDGHTLEVSEVDRLERVDDFVVGWERHQGHWVMRITSVFHRKGWRLVRNEQRSSAVVIVGGSGRRRVGLQQDGLVGVSGVCVHLLQEVGAEAHRLRPFGGVELLAEGKVAFALPFHLQEVTEERVEDARLSTVDIDLLVVNPGVVAGLS